ncbi:MAG: HupE/UreJ family protein [Gemmatimonadota bacterium]|nr:HupE/UreJ family protein [Gemmatimonadota bacterium]
MSGMWTFVELGFRHITDIRGLDHILFLFALAAIYRPRDWRSALLVVTAFTVGHSITLALAVTGAVRLPTALIEFLIPVTIVATCIENILVRDREKALWGGNYRPIFAAVFGLVHGAGFANYLRDLFIDGIAVPLLGFNIGIELGQVAVLAASALVLLAVDLGLGRLRNVAGWPSPLRIRVLAVSSVVMVVATRWAIERTPW